MSISFRNCEIMQEIDLYSIDKLKNKLDNSKAIKKYAFIVHDKDNTRPHFHCMIAFNNPNPLEAVASYFEIQPQYINKIKAGWKKAVQYLVHQNDSEKYQYDISAIVANYEVVDDFAVEPDYIGMIEKGEIREYEITDKIPCEFFIKHKKDIDNAFTYRYLVDLKEVKNRMINVYFIEGATGCGKSSYAKHICEAQNWSYCISSGSNDPLQDYKGESVLILDDLRDSTFKLNDLLKLLDNNSGSS